MDALDVTLLIDAVIALTLLECIALAVWQRGLLVDMRLNLASGLCLMVALRCLAAGVGLAGVAGCLAAAGLAHGADMIVRRRHRQAIDRTERRVLA